MVGTIFAVACLAMAVSVSVQAAEPESDPGAAWEVLSQQAGEQFAAGHQDAASSTLQQALQLAERQFPAGDERINQSVAMLGMLYIAQQRFADAEPLVKRAVAEAEAQPAPALDDYARQMAASSAFAPLIEWHFAQGQFAEAEAVFKRLVMYRFGPDAETRYPQELMEMGEIYADQSNAKHDRAEAFLKRSIELIEEREGTDSLKLVRPLSDLREAYRALGRVDDMKIISARIQELKAVPEGPAR